MLSAAGSRPGRRSVSASVSHRRPRDPAVMGFTRVYSILSPPQSRISDNSSDLPQCLSLFLDGDLYVSLKEVWTLFAFKHRHGAENCTASLFTLSVPSFCADILSNILITHSTFCLIKFTRLKHCRTGERMSIMSVAADDNIK